MRHGSWIFFLRRVNSVAHSLSSHKRDKSTLILQTAGRKLSSWLNILLCGVSYVYLLFNRWIFIYSWVFDMTPNTSVELAIWVYKPYLIIGSWRVPHVQVVFMACFMLMHLQLNGTFLLFFASRSCWWLYYFVHLSVKQSSFYMWDGFILLSLYFILNQNFSLWLLIIFRQISDYMMFLIDRLIFISRATITLEHCLHRSLARKRWRLSCLASHRHDFILSPLGDIVWVMIWHKRSWRELIHELFLNVI